MNEIAEILRLADSITTFGLLVIIVAAFVRGWVVSPREVQYREDTVQRLLQERNEWQHIAVQAVRLGERTVEVVRNGQQ